MPYFPSLNEYLHQSSLLIQAYPSTRITTRYSLPRKPKPSSKSKPPPPAETPPATDADTAASTQPKREPSATLTLKTYHPGSGICLKYKTDKAAEVGRLMTGLGRLAKGEVIEMPAVPAPGMGGEGGRGDRMDVDQPVGVENGGLKVEDKVATAPPVSQQTQQTQSGQQGGGKKKKKGKK